MLDWAGHFPPTWTMAHWSGGSTASPPPEHLRSLKRTAQVHQELKRKGVTLTLLWEEYRAAMGDVAFQDTARSDVSRAFASSTDETTAFSTRGLLGEKNSGEPLSSPEFFGTLLIWP